MRKRLNTFISNSLPFLLPVLNPISIIFFKRRYKSSSVEDIFTDIYKTNSWGCKDSRSGPGSDLIQTKTIREKLPELFKKLKIISLLDIPCGDFNWLSKVDLSFISYMGADIVSENVNHNNKKYAMKNRKFHKLNILEDELPKVDLIFCRDLFIHFSFKNIFTAIENIKKNGSKYLLTTSYPSTKKNNDILSGKWGPLNLLIPPFSFPPPLSEIDENSSEKGVPNKSLLLWKIEDL